MSGVRDATLYAEHDRQMRITSASRQGEGDGRQPPAASSKITPNRLQRRIAQAQCAHSGGRMIHDHDIGLSDESLNNLWGARVPQV